MLRYLRRRLHQRIALVAMLLLLWSQTVMAWHALCTHAQQLPAPVAQTVAMQGHMEHCSDTAPPAPIDNSLCAAHCDQGAPSSDVVRIPAFLALPALVPALTAALLPPSPAVVVQTDPPPPIPWNRPPLHPAALLLI